MAKAYRALVALVVLSCSQEFTNVTSNKLNDSDSGSSVRIPDSGPNAIPGDSPLDIRTQEASGPLPSKDSGIDSGSILHPDSMVDATQGPTNDAGQRAPEDASKEAALPTEAANPPAYCIDCQPQFGRPACCYMLFRMCSYLNGLNHCVQP